MLETKYILSRLAAFFLPVGRQNLGDALLDAHGDRNVTQCTEAYDSPWNVDCTTTVKGRRQAKKRQAGDGADQAAELGT